MNLRLSQYFLSIMLVCISIATFHCKSAETKRRVPPRPLESGGQNNMDAHGSSVASISFNAIDETFSGVKAGAIFIRVMKKEANGSFKSYEDVLVKNVSGTSPIQLEQNVAYAFHFELYKTEADANANDSKPLAGTIDKDPLCPFIQRTFTQSTGTVSIKVCAAKFYLPRPENVDVSLTVEIVKNSCAIIVADQEKTEEQKDLESCAKQCAEASATHCLFNNQYTTFQPMDAANTSLSYITERVSLSESPTCNIYRYSKKLKLLNVEVCEESGSPTQFSFRLNDEKVAKLDTALAAMKFEVSGGETCPVDLKKNWITLSDATGEITSYPNNSCVMEEAPKYWKSGENELQKALESASGIVLVKPASIDKTNDPEKVIKEGDGATPVGTSTESSCAPHVTTLCSPEEILFEPTNKDVSGCSYASFCVSANPPNPDPIRYGELFFDEDRLKGDDQIAVALLYSDEETPIRNSLPHCGKYTIDGKSVDKGDCKAATCNRDNIDIYGELNFEIKPVQYVEVSPNNFVTKLLAIDLSNLKDSLKVDLTYYADDDGTCKEENRRVRRLNPN